MKLGTKVVAGIAGTAALAGGALGIRRVRDDCRTTQLKQTVDTPAPGGVFTEALIDDLPEPARRYFLHAMQPGTPLVGSVTLQMFGSMIPKEEAARLELAAEEVLAPPHGFVWEAHAHMGPLPVRVRDYYLHGKGSVRVTALGIIPAAHDAGPDVARSSRHRLAGEAVWLPAALLPGHTATWDAIDADHARVTLAIDGEAIPLTLHIDEEGRLREVVMERYGDVGVSTWQLIPYGFRVEDEQTFDGYTIPTQLRGGWWYGTDRYDEATASSFCVHEAIFRRAP